jgi:4a-hydroxytetrahydrobiopterin dehydratase
LKDGERSGVAQGQELTDVRLLPWRGAPLKGEELSVFQKQVDAWNIIEEHQITKTFKFSDCRGALKFVNRVGELAEQQRHHPDISLAWGRVDITTWTHKVNGLTESDFILAAKINQLAKSQLYGVHQTTFHGPRRSLSLSEQVSDTGPPAVVGSLV